MQIGMETHRTILFYIIVGFYVYVKNILMTFLRQFLSNFRSAQWLYSGPMYTGGLQSGQAPMPSDMASSTVSSRRLL